MVKINEVRVLAGVNPWPAPADTPFGGPDLSNPALCLPISLDETDLNENFQYLLVLGSYCLS